jgi:hypothetical protein
MLPLVLLKEKKKDCQLQARVYPRSTLPMHGLKIGTYETNLLRDPKPIINQQNLKHEMIYMQSKRYWFKIPA